MSSWPLPDYWRSRNGEPPRKRSPTEWNRVLLSAVGGCELLMVASSPPLLMLVGGVGGAALIVVPWWRSAARHTVAGLVAVGTVPVALLGWTAVAPVLLAVVAWLIAVPLTRPGRSDVTADLP